MQLDDMAQAQTSMAHLLDVNLILNCPLIPSASARLGLPYPAELNL